MGKNNHISLESSPHQHLETCVILHSPHWLLGSPSVQVSLHCILKFMVIGKKCETEKRIKHLLWDSLCCGAHPRFLQGSRTCRTPEWDSPTNTTKSTKVMGTGTCLILAAESVERNLVLESILPYYLLTIHLWSKEHNLSEFNLICKVGGLPGFKTSFLRVIRFSTVKIKCH